MMHYEYFINIYKYVYNTLRILGLVKCYRLFCDCFHGLECAYAPVSAEECVCVCVCEQG